MTVLLVIPAAAIPRSCTTWAQDDLITTMCPDGLLGELVVWTGVATAALIGFGAAYGRMTQSGRLGHSRSR